MPLRAAHAYLLALAPEFVIEPYDNLASANGGPFQRRCCAVTIGGCSSIVMRRRSSTSERQTRSIHFGRIRISISRTSRTRYLLRAYDGQVLRPGQFLRRLAFLADGVLDRSFSGRVTYDVTFAANDEPV